MLSVDLASDGVYIAFPVTRKPVVSYTPFSPLPETGGSFLLHFPVSHLNLTLSGILLFEARTFLSRFPGSDHSQYFKALVYSRNSPPSIRNSGHILPRAISPLPLRDKRNRALFSLPFSREWLPVHRCKA